MKRSKFNLSHTKLLTCDMGQLIPCGLVEVLPGDTMQHAISMLVRAMPLQTPPMHRVRMKVHSWYVPNRITFPGWENFITGGPDGADATVFPTITLSAVAEKSLADYLGVPVGFSGPVNALPFRAYAKTFNEFYRDQDLVTPVALSEAAGPDTITNTALLNSAWDKDYFTTARPWEQKGPSISMPLGVTAPVRSDGTFPQMHGVAAGNHSINAVAGQAAYSLGATASVTEAMKFGTNTDPSLTGLEADLTQATAVDINTVREAFALQRYQEARARYGSRFSEYLAYLGIRSSDSRLQRPEYLSGGVQNLSFSEVLQTAYTTAAEEGVGQMYGHGIGAMRSNRYRKFFEEHGYIISLLHVLPETMYPQGLFRTWNRRVKEDYWQKELQHIGQQPVLTKEVYALGSNPDSVFGFQDRYDDYRRQESRVHGEFLTTLSDWHFARLLSAEPVLNGAFVTADPTKRCFQSQSTSTLLVQARHRIGARRMVAREGSSFIF